MNLKERAVYMLMEGVSTEEVIKFLFRELDEGKNQKNSKNSEKCCENSRTENHFVKKTSKTKEKKKSKKCEKDITGDRFHMKFKDFIIKPTKGGHSAEAKIDDIMIYLFGSDLNQIHDEVMLFYSNQMKYGTIYDPVKPVLYDEELSNLNDELPKMDIPTQINLMAFISNLTTKLCRFFEKRQMNDL